MKRIVDIIVALVLFIPVSSIAQPRDFSNLDKMWDTLWVCSDINRHLHADESGHLFYSIDQKAYMKERKDLMKQWNKIVKKERRKQYYDMCEYYKGRLYDAIEYGTTEDIIKEASLYVNIIHPDSLEQKSSIYVNVLLPLYSNIGELHEMHYISKLTEHYHLKEPSDPYLSSTSKEAFSVYEEYRSLLNEEELLKGMWVSNKFGKKDMPQVIMSIREDAENQIYGVLDENSIYSVSNNIRNSIVSRLFGVDSTGNYLVQFCRMEYKEGISENDVMFLSSAVNGLSQNLVKSIAESNMGAVGGSLLGLGVSVLSTVGILSIGNSSANALTNSYLNVTLKETDSKDVMLADFDLMQELRSSDNPTKPEIKNQRDTFELCRLLPEHGIFFTGKGLYPIVEHSRLAYLTPEYYRIYDGYKKYVRKYKTARNPSFWIFWYPLWPGMTALYVTTNSNSNNKVQKKKFNKIYLSQ